MAQAGALQQQRFTKDRAQLARSTSVGASIGVGLLYAIWLAHGFQASLKTSARLSLLFQRVTPLLLNSEQSRVTQYLPALTVTLQQAAKADSASSLAAPYCPMPEPDGVAFAQQLAYSVKSQLLQWNLEIAAYLEPVQWPEISERSRQAKVPIIMYHDVLPDKEIYFDITAEDLENDFRAIKAQGLTPISLSQMISHLRTGIPLPAKPVVLTFDDGYASHYNTVFKLLQQYQYPAAFAVFPGKLDGDVVGRSTLSWAQVKEMSESPLVTLVSHSVTHPSDLTTLSDTDLHRELKDSKQQLESKLGIPIRYFAYPEGNHDKRVVAATEAAGYEAALIMNNESGKFAGDSKNLLMIERFGESRFEEVTAAAWGGPPLPGSVSPSLNITTPISRSEVEIDDLPMTLIAGGQIQTIHANSRYPVVEIADKAETFAAVDGTFFSLESLDSNIMIGPVLSQNTGEFIPGSAGDIDKLTGRPLVLMRPQALKFVPFDPKKHNSLTGIKQEMPAVTDAFVGAAWLVHEHKAQSAATFKNLFAYEEPRHRAFWGINQQGQPVIGVTHAQIDSVGLGERLVKAGFQEAVMLDSGVSTSLAYRGESLMGFESRPVPHVLALVTGSCD